MKIELASAQVSLLIDEFSLSFSDRIGRVSVVLDYHRSLPSTSLGVARGILFARLRRVGSAARDSSEGFTCDKIVESIESLLFEGQTQMFP